MEKDKTVSIRYIVNDVAKAISFYKDLLDFKVDMHPAPGFAALSRGNLQLFINQPGAGGAGAKMHDGQSPEPGGWNRIQLPVTDLTAVYTGLKEQGATFRSDIIEGVGGRQALLQDPSGNLIELFEPKAQTDTKPKVQTEKKKVNPIPEGFHTVTPFLLADDAVKLIGFMEKAFDGKVTYMMKSDDGIIRHATVRIGDSPVMVSNGTELYKSMPCLLNLYVNDVDAVYHQAVKAGGKSVQEPVDRFYGDRTAGVEDAWQNQWWIATHIEDVSDEEIKKREVSAREKI